MLKTFLIGQIDAGQSQLSSTFAAVPDDKQSWKPLDNGRSALDLFGEAAQTAALAAQVVETRGEFQLSPAMFGTMQAERASWTQADAQNAMQTNHARLLAALENCSEEELAKPVSMPNLRNMTLPLGGWAAMAYRTYVSRFAQINYIQTLYGDFDMH